MFTEGKKLSLFLMIAVSALTACNRPSPKPRLAPDNLTSAGLVVVSPIEPYGFIMQSSLTDASELTRRLRAVEKAVPAVDYSRSNWAALRRDAFNSKRVSSVGASNSDYLMTIACAVDKSPLRFDKKDKNLYVEMYTDTPKSQAVVDDVRHYIDNKVEIELQLLKLSLDGLDASAFSQDDSSKVQDSLMPIAEHAAMVHLATSATITDQNPIGSAALDVGLAVSTSELAMSKFRLARVEGGTSDLDAVTSPLENLSRKMWGWPISYLDQPLWYRRLPYNGDPSKLCLIGKFKNVDLVSGGALDTPMVSPEAELVGDLQGWYVIDRSSGEIVARQ